MYKNTIYIKKSELDQFYTSQETALYCYNIILKEYDISKFKLFIEPSAGDGAFFKLLPEQKRIGIDIEPRYDGIIKKDFLSFSISNKHNDIIVIGNPPFGKNSSFAIKFFNKAAEFSNVICFIVPKTFKKASVHNRLDLNFWLKLSVDLPKKSFLLNNIPYDVPCCFQIWERKNIKRNILKISYDNNFFIFVNKNNADFAIRRVGGNTGKATSDIDELSETSHYFLKIKNKKDLEWLLEKINLIKFDCINDTAGVKSLSKYELIKTINNSIL